MEFRIWLGLCRLGSDTEAMLFKMVLKAAIYLPGLISIAACGDIQIQDIQLTMVTFRDIREDFTPQLTLGLQLAATSKFGMPT